MTFLSDPTLMLKLFGALAAAGAIHAGILKDWNWCGYYACAAGIQLFVLRMGD